MPAFDSGEGRHPTKSGSSQAAKAAAQRSAYSAGGASAKPDVGWHFRKSALQRK